MMPEPAIVCAVCRSPLGNNKMYCSHACYTKFLNTAEAQRKARTNGRLGGAPLGNTNAKKKDYDAPNHEGPGSAAQYQYYGCRCEACTTIKTLKWREYQRLAKLRKVEAMSRAIRELQVAEMANSVDSPENQ